MIKQLGRTLIELMIAMAIGLVIVFGMSALYSSAVQSTRLATQFGNMSEDTPLALHIIGQAVKRAGYGEIIGTSVAPIDQTLFAFPHLRACKSSSFTDPVNGDFSCTAATAGAPDSLFVQFQSDSVAAAPQRSTQDCLGANGILTTINDDTHAAYLAQVPLVSNLFSLTGSTITCSGNGAPAQSMASNVTEFRIYFGFDEVAATQALSGLTSASPAASTVVDANYIQTKQASFVGKKISAWDFVVSVHLCSVATTQSKGTSVAQAVSYEGCPDDVSQVLMPAGPTRTASDGAVRKTYRQVYTIRSRATGSPSFRAGA